MWNREREQIDGKFRDVFKTFEGVTKRIEVLEKGRDVSAKLKGSGIQDCMRLITALSQEQRDMKRLAATRNKNTVESMDTTDETVAKMNSTMLAMQDHSQRLHDRIEELERRLGPVSGIRAYVGDPVPAGSLQGAAEGAMSHVTPMTSQLRYGTWDKEAMSHVKRLRVAATYLRGPDQGHLLNAADFLEETVAASEGSYK